MHRSIAIATHLPWIANSLNPNFFFGPIPKGRSYLTHIGSIPCCIEHRTYSHLKFFCSCRRTTLTSKQTYTHQIFVIYLNGPTLASGLAATATAAFSTTVSNTWWKSSSISHYPLMQLLSSCVCSFGAAALPLFAGRCLNATYRCGVGWRQGYWNLTLPACHNRTFLALLWQL